MHRAPQLGHGRGGFFFGGGLDQKAIFRKNELSPGGRFLPVGGGGGMGWNGGLRTNGQL